MLGFPRQSEREGKRDREQTPLKKKCWQVKQIWETPSIKVA